MHKILPMLLGAAGGAAPGTPEAEWNALESWAAGETPNYLYTTKQAIPTVAPLDGEWNFVRLDAVLPANLADVGCLCEFGGTGAGFGVGEAIAEVGTDLYAGCGAGIEWNRSDASYVGFDIDPGNLGQEVSFWFYLYQDDGIYCRMIMWANFPVEGIQRFDAIIGTQSIVQLWGSDTGGYLTPGGGATRAGVVAEVSSANPGTEGLSIFIEPATLPTGVNLINANVP